MIFTAYREEKIMAAATRDGWAIFSVLLTDNNQARDCRRLRLIEEIRLGLRRGIFLRYIP